MADKPPANIDQDERLMAIPRLAEDVGVTPRILRYWEEQGLISPTREHGKLRYSPRDLAIARLIKVLLEAGMGVDGIRVLKELSERDIRWAGATGDESELAEVALRILYQRKAFREVTGEDEAHFREGKPKPEGRPKPERKPKPRPKPPHGRHGEARKPS